MKNCIAPFWGLDDLVKASNETLYDLACVIDKILRYLLSLPT